MQKVKEYKVIIVAILTLIIFFSWFGVRPVMVRANCHDESMDKSVEKNKLNDSATYLYDRAQSTGKVEPAYIQDHLDIIASQTTFQIGDYNTYYKLCLQSNGL